MSQPIRAAIAFLPERFRLRFGRDNAKGAVLALAVEALLVLALLTLGTSITHEEKTKGDLTVVEFRAASEWEEAADSPEQSETQEVRQPRPSTDQPQPAEAEPRPAEPRPDPPELLELSPDELAAADLSKMKSRPRPSGAPARPTIGPADTGTPGDTPRVSGSGPNGEPLYAAAWYREPYDDELRGYLSTATGPGWALIACRTAPNYRVENCIKIDEYPAGSNMARAVLAAAWQFQVRPPRVGGRSMVGEWVRIRIDYELRRK